MPKKTKTEKTTEIDSIKHPADTRKNIPTEELRGFVSEQEHQPKKVLYPRNPDLDPQLVWKGKDEQDSQDLVVDAPPIYIQEKIHPQAIIQDIQSNAKKEQPQIDLFADFNGISFEQMIEFYQHDQHWSNRMILGDSLQVMASLAEKENLKGQVQMIYLDPPYGIKFGSNWQVSTQKRDVKDGKAEDCTRQPEQIKAFRDTWELGIHSYLAYLRDRLTVARELLTESGSIFVQIGDENVHLVRCLLDEVFGGDNFVSLITVRKTMPLGSSGLAGICDYVIWYSKSQENYKYRQLYIEKIYGRNIEFTSSDLKSSGYTPSCTYDFYFQGRTIKAQNKSWRTHPEGMQRAIKADRLIDSGVIPRYKQYNFDFPVQQLNNLWIDTIGATDMIYVVQTANKIVERCLLMTTDPGDLVLDPTCGSGTTAYVAEQWGRRWITIDTSRVALALARTRLMSAKYPYYLLADSKDGIQKLAELQGKLPQETKPKGNIKHGFVYKTVPHITLKAIANNEQIDVIHDKWQTQLEPIRQQLNTLLNKDWQEWEIPREPAKDWDKTTKDLLAKWWNCRQQRQQEIDNSIAKNADMETLYDQPYEDNKRVRVTGPFTVESLSPHRILPTDDTPEHESQSKQERDFETMILDNLRKAGVQNTVKQERIEFNRLEPFAGKWIQAEGEYTDKNSKNIRVAVFIGSEHNTVNTLQVKEAAIEATFGTISERQIREAAKEAVQGIEFNLLLICGLAFDPSVSEEAKRYGNLTILPVKMNPDLTIGDELLKKTGSGNLFMVFGEPDIKLTEDDGKIQVELLGVDIYDPTTGIIRSNSTDGVACWFIDTNYNGESFFVRHAYFTGADKPYEKLQKILRAEVNEEAWNTLYSTISRPFEQPRTGKIAVKVINHYGDEVIKVFDV